ncbi:MAG: dihydroorotase [Acidobacteriota bacterium]|jgi:dihydroorotase|nr:dihydroorotase [Acidobacteriota bacterium]
MKLLIKNGRLVDPLNHTDDTVDILIDGQSVADIQPRLDAGKVDRLIDAAGLVVCPGFIDMHVHLREPGNENKETIQSGVEAAVHGGFTSVACMPNTSPVNDNRTVTEYIIARARSVGLANVFPVAAISRGLEGRNLTEMADLAEGGAVGFSDDGSCVMSADLIRKALEYCRMLGLPIIEHPEDHSISGEGLVNEGLISYRYGMRGILNAAEEVIVARDIILQDRIRSRLHLTHISTSRAVDLIRDAKAGGIPVTADATPHHLLLNEEKITTYDTVYKVKPPLRTEADRLALVEGLKDGTIDCIASDHAPHTRDEKDKEFEYAPFGVIGLESTVSVVYDRLVRTKTISLKRMVELLSTNPARVLNLKDRGQVTLGKPADLTLLDLNRRFSIQEADFRSKANNCPFLNWEGMGKVAFTIVSGKVVYESIP